MIRRGEIYWAALGSPEGSQPANRRPVLVVQADSFNASRIATAIGAIITSNPRLADAPGNVALAKAESRLPRDSVVNVSQLVTLNKVALSKRVSQIAPETMDEIATGLRLVLNL